MLILIYKSPFVIIEIMVKIQVIYTRKKLTYRMLS